MLRDEVIYLNDEERALIRAALLAFQSGLVQRALAAGPSPGYDRDIQECGYLLTRFQEVE